MLTPPHSNQFSKDKVNWIKEWLIGAAVSFVFTLATVHAGTKGVVDGSLAAHIRDFVIIGGMTMSMVCFYAAVVTAFGQMLDGLRKKTNAQADKGGRLFGNLSTVKLLKIFLP